ncbi:MAG: hypothetical protein WAU77_00885 [Solirubrobacteraceae bacterium]
MDVSQLRGLALADLGERELRELIAAGETVARRESSVHEYPVGRQEPAEGRATLEHECRCRYRPQTT